MMYEGNPAWTISVLREHWGAIIKRVDPSWLPVRAPLCKGFQEYGQGHFGCVMPTGDPKVVCKVTSDVSEAGFVAIALSLPEIEYPEGLTRYCKVLALPSTTYRGRPLFLLWREAAESVGGLTCYQAWGKTSPDIREEIRFCNRLHSFQQFASVVRQSLLREPSRMVEAAKLENWAWGFVSDLWDDGISSSKRAIAQVERLRGAHRVAAALRVCGYLAEMMDSEPQGYLVGGALVYYLQRGILLADVHTNNIGKSLRYESRSPMWTITDPGHAVLLDNRYRDILVEQL